MGVGIGDTLRVAREEQGRSLDEAARATRVRIDYLEALEDERFAVIGGDVYAKGFLRSYARYLGLNPDPLLDRYRRDVQRDGYDAHALVEHPVARPARRGVPPWLTWAAVALVASVLALAVVGTFGGRTPRPAAQPTTLPGVGASEPPAEDPTTSPPEASTPSPTPTTVAIEMLFEERSWIRVRLGGEAGQTVLERIVEAGQTQQFSHPEAVYVHLGNAGGVRVVLNGSEVGSLAGRGDIWRGTCTTQGCQEAA